MLPESGESRELLSYAREPAAADAVYSLGHSNQTLEEFLALLQRREIKLLMDCRSTPYCHYSQHFDREELVHSLLAAGIRYMFAGDQLGGRPEAAPPSDYAEMANRPAFRRGIEMILQAGRGEPLCLLCSEEDPRRCHRSQLIAHELLSAGVDVRHIRGDDREERQSELEREAARRRQFSLFAENPKE
jgi:uncharacterized protein (DUF488 family)